jgi:ketosteroid isomerase-like protein
MSVYAEDVIFVETPFSSSLKGREEVRRYWADTPYQQSEVTFTSGEIYSAGPGNGLKPEEPSSAKRKAT